MASGKVLEESINQDLEAKAIGEVTDEPGIRISNRGAVKEHEWLNF